MAFIINKPIKGYCTYYYLVQNYRSENKVKRETLLKLGSCKTLAEFLERLKQNEAQQVKRLDRSILQLKFLETKHLAPTLMLNMPFYKINRVLREAVEREKQELEESRAHIRKVKSYM